MLRGSLRGDVQQVATSGAKWDMRRSQKTVGDAASSIAVAAPLDDTRAPYACCCRGSVLRTGRMKEEKGGGGAYGSDFGYGVGCFAVTLEGKGRISGDPAGELTFRKTLYA